MEGSINLRIKTLDGREHVIELSRDSSICDLKNKIERNIGVARDLQRIIFQGRCLTDDLTVATAGIENNSVVHLVERAPPPTSGAPTGNENTGSENRTCRCWSCRYQNCRYQTCKFTNPVHNGVEAR